MQTVDNRSLVLFLSGLAAAGTAVCIAVSCSDQPRPKCTTGRGQFSAIYAPKGAAAMGDCAIKGEVLGVQPYNPAKDDRSNVDLKRGSLALKGSLMTDAIGAHAVGDPDPKHSPNSVGDFTTAEPGGDNFCDVPQLSRAEQDLPYMPAVPPLPDAGPDAEGTPAVAAQHVVYNWSNVRVMVSAEANGTQLVGDLAISTDTTEGPPDGGATSTHCESSYRVRALFPAASCAEVLDEDNKVVHEAGFCLCLPYGDADNKRSTGSGISSSLFGPEAYGAQACEASTANRDAMEAQSKVTCDSTLHLCVLKADP